MPPFEAQPLNGAAGDYDDLLERIGEAGVVLLGEASHGTHEFYRERALITRRLIEEHGFGAVDETRGRATGAHRRLGAGRAARDLSHGAVSKAGAG